MTNAKMKTAGRACEPGVNATVLFAAVLFLAGTSGCEPMEPSAEALELESQDQEIRSENGLSANGLSANGLSANGLSANGLSANGLSANGLSNTTFSEWFTQNRATSEMVMRYVVRCAVPAGQSRTFVDPQTGQHHTWAGVLGLAPGWSSGAPASLNEQKLISACLLAHVNRSGMNLPISVLGRDALGSLIPYTRQELMTYSIHEACFFGNLFTQQGLFLGVDRPKGHGTYFTRACSNMGGDNANGPSANLSCGALQYVGSCLSHCQVDFQGGPFYRTCSYGGVSYPAITTRMRPQDFGNLVADLVE
jgi:hypothetical protein